MKERIGNLSPGRHVPRLAMEWLDETPDQRWRSVTGAMVFADISGFTALSEKLAKRGRIGAEELVETLSRIFSDMLDVTSHRGGQLIKFGGDALLLLFDDRDTGGRATEQAAAAAVEMRAALRRASEIRTSVGRLNLKISIGVHAGVFDYFLVGHPHRELVALGPGLTAVVAAENAAVAGEILLSPAAAAMLPASATTDGTDGHRRLLWRKAPVPPAGRPPRINDRRAARHLFPRILFPLVDGVRPDPGHRIGTIGFMKFSGTDEILERQGPEHLAEALDQTLRIAQAAYEAEDVALLCVDGDKDGGKLFVSSGVPLTSEDDEGRMLRAATAIIAARPPLPIQIGINRGHVFAAEVGSHRRAAYSAMGDTTNTAARICGKAAPGEILVHPSVLQHARTAYESEPVGPFTFKGKALPQMLNRLGAEIGPRERRDEADELALFGREHELGLIGEAAQIRPDRGATIEVHGPVGVGKTRLMTEVVRNLPELPRLTLHAEPYGAAPYRVFRDAIRAELGVDRGEQMAMRAQLLAALRRVAPRLLDLAALIGDVAQVEVDPSPAVRAILPAHRADRVADTLLELLHALHPEGLIVVMEDAQWADPASAHLLRRIGSETHRAPWLLLVTHRNAESDAGFDLDAPDLSLELAPLADEAVRALSVAMTELAPLRPDELALVVERADGSPLFARALIRARRQLGSLEGVPDSLQGAVAAQIDVLDPTTRRALAFASVLGRSFRGAVFETVLAAEGIDLDLRLRDNLDRFLAVDEQDRWHFRHGVLSEVVYDGLGYNLRARLHLGAGRAVESLSSDLLLDADTLALHFSRAGHHENAYTYGVMAASRSEMAYAYPAAAAQLTLALQSARRLKTTPAQLRDLWVRLAVAKHTCLDLGGALEALRHALRLHGDPVDDARVLLRLADVRDNMGSFSAALRDVSRALTAVSTIDGRAAATVRARAHVAAAGIRMRQQKAQQSLEIALVGAAEAEACGDTWAVAQAESMLSWAHLMTGRPDRAAESGTIALRLFQQIDDAKGRIQMANNLGGLAYYEGDWQTTVSSYREAMDAAVRAGDTTMQHIIGGNLGEVLVNQRRLDEAEGLLLEASRSQRASGHSLAAWTEVQLGRLLIARGRLPEAEVLLTRCVIETRGLGANESCFEASIHLGACLVAAGRPEEALRVIDAGQVGELSFLDPTAALVRASAFGALGQLDRATESIRRGVDTARTQDLGFDLAHLVLLADDLGIDGFGPTGPAREILASLGVRLAD